MCHVIPCYDTASHRRSSVSDNVSDTRAGVAWGQGGGGGGGGAPFIPHVITLGPQWVPPSYHIVDQYVNHYISQTASMQWALQGGPFI